MVVICDSSTLSANEYLGYRVNGVTIEAEFLLSLSIRLIDNLYSIPTNQVHVR